MRRATTLALFLSLSGATFVVLPTAAQDILRREPAKGALRYGEKVLVDDGRCPRGQVREVTGGRISDRDARRPTTATQSRERRCVARPS